MIRRAQGLLFHCPRQDSQFREPLAELCSSLMPDPHLYLPCSLIINIDAGQPNCSAAFLATPAACSSAQYLQDSPEQPSPLQLGASLHKQPAHTLTVTKRTGSHVDSLITILRVHSIVRRCDGFILWYYCSSVQKRRTSAPTNSSQLEADIHRVHTHCCSAKRAGLPIKADGVRYHQHE